MARKPLSELERLKEERKKSALASLEVFIISVEPKRFLGNVHREVINWWTASDAKSHQLLLLPRDHMKSYLVACRAAWEIVRNPAIRILYISSTANLAIKQLKLIKDILTSDFVRTHWPELIYQEEAKRELWTQKEIAVDHPKRRQEFIRDPTVFTAGLTTNIVGMHCDVAILDDVVVQTNAYSKTGREKVLMQYGYLSSVGGTQAREWVVGTRYDPNDLYGTLISGMKIQKYDDYGSNISEEDLFDVREWAVENVGDGSGEYIWPYSQRFDGKWFGFNREILEKKKSQYQNNMVQFRAQYYNNPNSDESAIIKRDNFQYYDKNFVNQKNYHWYFKDTRLNIVAAVDFAFSEDQKADFTSIVVVGADGVGNYYILDIDRFKTNKMSEYFKHILFLYERWGFRQLKAEINAGAKAIVTDLKENYIKRNGLSLSIEEVHRSRWEGAKAERINAVLQAKYDNKQIWHYQSGNTQLLEEELVLTKPPHDDIKDTLASAIDFVMAPKNSYTHMRSSEPAFQFHSRWGGVA